MFKKNPRKRLVLIPMCLICAILSVIFDYIITKGEYTNAVLIVPLMLFEVYVAGVGAGVIYKPKNLEDEKLDDIFSGCFYSTLCMIICLIYEMTTY